MLQRLLSRFRRSAKTATKRPKVNLNRLRLSFDCLEDRTVPSVNVGTIHLTNNVGTTVEQTHYAAKPDVYVYGNGLTNGWYDIEVIAPGGRADPQVLLGIDLSGTVHVTNGNFDSIDGGNVLGTNTPGANHNISQPISVWYQVRQTGVNGGTAGDVGFDDTTNNGGEYQVVVARHSNFDGNGNPIADGDFPTNDVAKSKNFKVVESFPTQGTSITTAYWLSNNLTQVPSGDDSTEPGTVTAPLGSTAYDTATVIDEHGDPVPVGSVTFYFYSGAGDLLGTTANVPVNANGIASPSATELPGGLGAGDYYFTATYTDGMIYDSSTSGAEPFTINKGTLTLVTDIKDLGNGPVSGVLGETVYDTYHLVGDQPFAFTGTVNYTFNSNDAGSGSQSNPEGPLQAGDYVFQASSTGDSNYNLNAIEPESLHIFQGILTPQSFFTTIYNAADNTVIPNNSDLKFGTSVYDTATFGGTLPFAPDSTKVSFTFDGSAAGSGILTSSTETAIASGNHAFTASFAGDNNYKPFTSDSEPFHINFPPLVVGHTYDCVNVGSTYSAPNTYGPGVLGGASDPDSGPNALTAVLDSGPSHNALSPVFVLNSDGSFSYTPDATWAAAQPTGSHPTDSFTYHATDGLNNSNVATATLTINRAPHAVADGISTQLNVPKSGNVLTNDTDPDAASAVADGATVTAVNGVAGNVGMTINLGSGSTLKVNSDGSYTYTPGPDFHGIQSFSYTIKDHCGLSSTVTDTFTVTSGALTQGYWKTHQAAFNAVLAAHPNVPGFTSGGLLLIAGIGYNSTDAIALMNLSTGSGTSANAILMLWQQQVAAKLNVLNGVVGDAADNTAIADADAAITLASTSQNGGVNKKLAINSHGAVIWSGTTISAFVSTSSTLGQRMVNDNNILTAFNQTGT